MEQGHNRGVWCSHEYCTNFRAVILCTHLIPRGKHVNDLVYATSIQWVKARTARREGTRNF